jgi:hypothetical protein
MAEKLHDQLLGAIKRCSGALRLFGLDAADLAKGYQDRWVSPLRLNLSTSQPSSLRD